MKTRAKQLTAPVIAFMVLTWLFFTMRIFVRLRSLKKLLIDDWLLSLGMIFFTTFGCLYLTAAYWGFGKHIVDLDAHSQKNAVHAWFYTDIFSTLCTCLLRLAAAYHLLRHVTRSWQRSVIYIGSGVNIAYSVFLVFVLIFRCKPISWFWDRTDHLQYETGGVDEGSCDASLSRHGKYAECVMSAIVDWSFASLPLIMMRNVDMGKLHRGAVSLIVLLGQAAGFVIIARIPAYRGLSIHADFTYSSVPIGVLTTTEPGLIIIALCLATFSPLLPSSKTTNRRIRQYPNWDDESNIRGIPLERNIGATTLITSDGKEKNTSSPNVSRPSLIKMPLKAKTKDGFKSTDTLVLHNDGGSGRVSPIEGMAIAKTTDVATFSDEDLSTKTAAQPASTLKR